MSDTSPPESQGAANADIAATRLPTKKQSGPPKDVPLPAPTLAAYYGKRAPQPKDWFKAIKAAKVNVFSEEDIEAARAGLAESDFELRRTLKLAIEPSPPGLVRFWVNDVTQRALKHQLPDLLFDPMAPAGEQIGRIADGLRVGLASANKRDRAKGETLLQLAMQLILKRHSDFDPGTLLGVLFQPLRLAGNADMRLATSELRKRLLQANVRQLREFSLVHASAQDRIAQAEQARRDQHERAEDALAKLRMTRDQVETLKSQLAESQTQAEALSAEVARLKTAIHDTQQIGAHGTAAVTAKMRSLLAHRLPPLLEDAADALSGERQYADVALERIASVRNIIKGEVAWLDESSD
jgi:hypothetical protein